MTADMKKETKNGTGDKTWPQWIAGISVSLLLLQIGMLAGWSSPYVAKLLSGEATWTITTSEATWVVTLLNLGRFFGAFVGAVCVTYTGSKTSLLITSTPIALCWILCILANNVVWLYVARFLGGMGLGMSYSCFSLYIGEIANPEIRGALVTLGMTGMSSGNMVICIMGTYLSMVVSSSINLLLNIIVMCLFLWLPDTPHHLVRNKNEEKAKRSLLFYHRNCDVETEFTTLKKFIESCNQGSTIESLKEFRVPQIRKALMVTFMLFFFAQMCGLNNILFYMETILRSARVTVIDPPFVVIISMFSGIVASLLSMTMIDRCGRRFLMCTASVIVSMSLIGLGMRFHLIELNFDPETFQWVPILSMIFFQMAAFGGILAVPSAVVGEIFPPNVKCIAASMTSVAAAFFAFVSTSTYQVFVNLMTEKFTFWMYSIFLLMCVPATLIFLPETKGKSLQEIQDCLMKTAETKSKSVEDAVTRY